MEDQSEKLKSILKQLAETSNTSKDVHDIYSDWAKQYDVEMDANGTYHGPFQYAKHLDEMCPNKDARLLDIGAGTGLLGLQLKSRGFTNIDALDANESMLNLSRRHNVYKNYYVDFLGTNRLNIDDDTYDVVIGCGVFVPGHVSEDCFDELCRITKPGGIIIIASNEKYANEESAFFLKRIQAKIELYEERGVWKIESQKYLPHLGDYKAPATTVRMSTH